MSVRVRAVRLSTGPHVAQQAAVSRQLEMSLVRATNVHRAKTARGTRLTFTRAPLIRKSDKVFTMGSCFSREISYVLRDTGFELFPRYSEIDFDRATQKPFKIKRRSDMNHYNTFTIRYEFEHAFANTHYGIADFIELPSRFNPTGGSGRIPIADRFMR